MTTDEINALSNSIIGAAIEVHKILGPGLLENTYRLALMQELRLRGIKAKTEEPIPYIYKGITLDASFRADIIAEDEVIIELKACDGNVSLFRKQLNTYLRISDKRLGLLINFNYGKLVDGIARVVNNL